MLDVLPIEVLNLVLVHLTPYDLLSLSETSSKLCRCAGQAHLWHKLLQPAKPFDVRRNYRHEYAWRHGTLSVDVRSDLAPNNEELFKTLTFFPLHRSYSGKSLAACSPDNIPWATKTLENEPSDLLVLACRENDLIAHIYRDNANSVARHTLLILRRDQAPVELHGLPDWPLCATFLGRNHILVAGRFPAVLLWDLDDPRQQPIGLPLSSHTIHCMTMEAPEYCQQILLCGHYKGRGSMEILEYHFSDSGKLAISVSDRNRFAGITTIVSCAYLPGGSFMTYDNYAHIYLWSSLHEAVRKIDHDGIGDDIPTEMIYKMFYLGGQLVFIDQYKRQHAFVIRPGRKAKRPERTAEPALPETEAAEMKQLLLRQDTDMASLTRRVLGI